MRRAVLSEAGEHLGELAGFLRELIAIRSFSGKEGEAVRRIEAQAWHLGYDRVETDTFGNVLAWMGRGPRLLAIDGHCDTVGPGRRDLWSADPFSGERRDGVIYGRGAADQKGGLAAALYAGSLVRRMGLPDGITVLVVASVLEEDAEGLAWDFLIGEKGVRPEAVLLTEPSDLGIRIGQRGRLEIEICVDGTSCHGSVPERGENAVYRALPVIQAVRDLNARLKETPPLGKGSVTVTRVCSSAPSLCAVPDRLAVHLDRRLSAEETMDSCVRQIRELPPVRETGARITVPEYEFTTHTGLSRTIQAHFPSWLMDASDPLVERAVETYRDLGWGRAPVGVWRFSTNGVSTMGKYRIPTIGFGPGKEEHAHTALDQVREDHLVRALAFYTAFILSWAGHESS
jgi:putative selenium metabolism hydrolase